MNYSDITVKKYFDILDTIKEEKDPILLNAKLIDCLWEVNSEDIPWAEFSKYVEELSFLKEPYKPKNPKSIYTINGIKFKPTLDISKITTAQYIDFQELMKRNDNKTILNCIFIKDGEVYGDSDNSEFLWNHLTINIYSDVMFFFLKFSKNLMKDTLNYSKKMLKKLLKTETNKTQRIKYLRTLILLQQTLSQANGDGLFE